jgi:hypothetical protein
MSQQKSEPQKSVSVGLCVIALFLMAILWILFVGGTRRDEMIVGAGVLMLSGAFLHLVARRETLTLDFRWSDVVTGWRIPWYIVSRVYQITVFLMKDLFGIKPIGSFYRFSGFKTSKYDPRLIARRVLATAYTTAAPNFIVIGIDYHQSRMLFHQLERSSVSKMTKELGAQPGAERQ